MDLSDRLYRTFARKVGLPDPVVDDVRVRRGLTIPLADGVVTKADHWTPVGIDKPPLVLIRSPYGRRAFGVLFGRTLAHQGFQVVLQACRGTGGSDGVLDEPFSCEVADGAATVEWLRKQSFYPGRFFTYGESYLGWNQIALAPAAGDDLAGMVLRVAPSSVYDMAWPDGTLILKAGLTWAAMARTSLSVSLPTLIRGLRIAPKIVRVGKQAPVLTAYQSLANGTNPVFESWARHRERSDPHWDRDEIIGHLDAVTCPVLITAGWYDLFIEDCLKQHEHLRKAGAPVEIHAGVWSHAEVLRKGLGPSLTDEVAFLRDIAGLAKRPPTSPVRLHMINGPTLMLDELPVATDEPRRWALATASLAADSDTGSTTFTSEPQDPTPSVGGATNDETGGSKDNTELEARADVVTFTSTRLEHDLDVYGSPAVDLVVTSDRPDTAVFVRLCEVKADGTSWNHTDRLVRLPANERDDEGRWNRRIELPPVLLRIPAGHRVRLQISGGSFPRFARHPGTAENPLAAVRFHPAHQTIHHDGSALSLPLLSR